MPRPSKLSLSLLTVLIASTLMSATAVVAAAKKPRAGTSSQAVDHQEIAWRMGKTNRVYTTSERWTLLPMPAGGCHIGEDLCSTSSFPGIMIPAKGEISVTFSGNFSRAPVELRVKDVGRVMRPGGVKFRPRPHGNSFSYTFVSDRKHIERVCAEVTFNWRSPTGEEVRLNKASIVVHYKKFVPDEPVGCADARYPRGVADPAEELKDLDAKLASVEAVLNLDRMRKDLADLEQQAGDPDLWNDQERAQKVNSRLSHVRSEITRVEGLRSRINDLAAAVELGDEELLAEADEDLPKLRRDVEALEVRTLLSGDYDAREALVTINSGTGGTDAADWAEMLLRMFLRWAERHGYPTEVYDTSYAEEAGIKSATFVVKVPYAYGTLAGEHGRHRLVRISPFDNQSRRQTSFADVDVTPVVEQTDHIDIPDDEVRVDVYRSSGPGGQGVNTTDSAVRLTHLPSGIVVTCQNERSQLQNRARAFEVLQAKLLELRRQQDAAEMDKLRGTHQSASFGAGENKVRDYVLHPYQLVKDARTDVETGNTTAVLDGDIDDFVEAEIRWRRRGDPEG